MEQMNCNMAVEGTLLDCPVQIILGYEEKELSFCGNISWDNRHLVELLSEVCPVMNQAIRNYARQLCPVGSGNLTILHHHAVTTYRYIENTFYFKIVVMADGIALLFSFDAENQEDSSFLITGVKKVAGFFGIRQFHFYAQTGTILLFSELLAEQLLEIPDVIQKCDYLIYANVSMTEDNLFQNAVRTLLGFSETVLYLGGQDKELFCIMNIPKVHNAFIESRELYFILKLGNTIDFVLQGTFIFPFLKEMEFTVDCAVSTKKFAIEALAKVEKPLSLVGPFSIGETFLMITYSAELSFALYTNLYIRELHLFGAIMLETIPAGVKMNLLSASVSDLSIPILLDNLCGEHIAGIEDFDFIKILGLPFQNIEGLTLEDVKKADTGRIVKCFNDNMSDASFHLSEPEVQVMPFQNGLNVTDTKRMRHYYIDNNGKWKLLAQMYYSDVDTTMGSYEIKKGFFLCGVIELFKIRFEVLFSYREEGLVAYAKIPAINLGFLEIGPSRISELSGETLPVAQKSLLYQFVGNKKDGLVFFLSAGKKEVSFYLDGYLRLLSIIETDVRLVFCEKQLSADVQFNLLSLFLVSLHFKVNYSSFTDGGFEFELIFDTSGLEKKLRGVHEKISLAIEKYKKTIESAKQKINQAQAHVNELYGQIAVLDNKIEKCKADVKKAKWWKRAFVAIAKGIEIGAYEIAKVGIYAAIGVATAALQVAKATLEMTGKVGEGVLKAANAIIEGALSFFYVNKITLKGLADVKSQELAASIDFVALGKTYSATGKIGTDKLQKDAEGELSLTMNRSMQSDLDAIGNGTPVRSNWKRYRHDNYTIRQQCQCIDSVKEQMKSSIGMLKDMENAYASGLNEPMAEFDELNTACLNAFSDVENILNVGIQAGDLSKISRNMGGLKRSLASRQKQGVFRSDEWNEEVTLLAQYDEAKLLYDKVKSSVMAVGRQNGKLKKHVEQLKEETQRDSLTAVMDGSKKDMADVLIKVEELTYRHFPVERNNSNFISLSREKVIQESFAEAEQKLGLELTEELLVQRNRSRKGMYKSRM